MDKIFTGIHFINFFFTAIGSSVKFATVSSDPVALFPVIGSGGSGSQ
jgi:hypothetical protein